MDDDQQFCLRWNNHQSTLISVFDTLLENGTLVDCTLAAEGKFLKAHKVVLCACSPYFASLLSQQYDKHPIFILKDVKFQELRAMMDYMYRGEVNISQDQLAALLKAAESLQIKGLSDNRSAAKGVDSAQQKQQSQVPVSGGAAGSAAKTGLTIEQNKRLRVAADAELSGSREGSTSPSSRKRKKVRRRSVDTNNAAAIDNHDQMSNSSSQSATQQQAQPITSTPLTLSQITTATSAANVLNVTKKTDNNSNDDDEEEEQTIVRHKTRNTDGSNKDKIDSDILIEPKSEFEDGNDEPVEDLTMGDEDLMEDLEQAGPSHGGEGSSQGYQWQVDRSQDEVYLATQESSGQHRDAQGKSSKQSGLLENDDIIVSRRDNSYVFTAKKTYNPKRANGLEAMLKKAGAEGVTVTSIWNRNQNAGSDTEKEPELSFLTRDSEKRRKSLNQSLASKSLGGSINEEVEDYMEIAELADFEEITFDGNQMMTAIIDKEENILFTQDNNTNMSNESTENYSIIAAENIVGGDDITFSEGSNSCTFKIEYPMSDSSVNCSEENSSQIDKPFGCRHCGKMYRWKSTLRRHENVECGGKAPSYECPYCSYKAKQRGNLGVHVRKHHPEMPQLESRRKKQMK